MALSNNHIHSNLAEASQYLLRMAEPLHRSQMQDSQKDEVGEKCQAVLDEIAHYNNEKQDSLERLAFVMGGFFRSCLDTIMRKFGLVSKLKDDSSGVNHDSLGPKIQTVALRDLPEAQVYFQELSDKPDILDYFQGSLEREEEEEDDDEDEEDDTHKFDLKEKKQQNDRFAEERRAYDNVRSEIFDPEKKHFEETVLIPAAKKRDETKRQFLDCLESGRDSEHKTYEERLNALEACHFNQKREAFYDATNVYKTMCWAGNSNDGGCRTAVFLRDSEIVSLYDAALGITVDADALSRKRNAVEF